MKAIQYQAYGLPEVLEVVTTPIPKIKAGYVLIKVSASSVNAADIMVRSGKIKFLSGKKFPKGTGFDFTGQIIEVGSSSNGLKKGDEVWGFLNDIKQSFPATAAEYVIAPVGAVALRPTTLDSVSAVALPGVGGAALGVLNQGKVKSGEKILIRGGAGGVGSMAVQMAHFLGMHVTTLTSAKHMKAVGDLGADKVLDYRIAKPNELGQFDVVFDTVGKGMGIYRKLLKPGGRYLTITVGGLSDILYMLGSKIFGKRSVRLIQSPPDGKMLAALTEYVDKKGLLPVIEKIYSMEEIVAAHRLLEAGGVLGKIVIKIDQ